MNSRTLRGIAATIVFCALSISPALAQFAQLGNKLVGSGATGNARQGYSVAISRDGNTAIVGGLVDNANVGAAWIYVRSGGTWTQQGSKLVGAGGTGSSTFGSSVALSSDGNTAIVGGQSDNGEVGAFWIFTRSGTTWSPQGGKIVPGDVVGAARVGNSVALSNDGNTAVIGGYGDNTYIGATWVYVRSGAVWAYQVKLIGTGVTGSSPGQGTAVAVSADGNTVITGASGDDSAGSVGAAWVFTRSGVIWSQQGGKLVGTGYAGGPMMGSSVALSSDGNTALVGGPGNFEHGATWVFTRSGVTWSQQAMLDAADSAIGTAQGDSVALSADGNIAIVGGSNDNSQTGAAFAFRRNGTTWTQLGSRLTASDQIGDDRSFGYSISLSGDGNIAIVGQFARAFPNNYAGGAWIFTQPVMTVTPATNVSSAGIPGGPFTPSSFPYTLTSPTGFPVAYSITGLPTWLTASPPSGTVDPVNGTVVTLSVNAAANPLQTGTYGPTTFTFSNTSNGPGTQTRTATLTVSATPSLVVTPAGDMVSSGNQGGPFSPPSFNYQLSTPAGTVPFSITGLPAWLTASATSGTATTTPTTITFTINGNALLPSTYGPQTITFRNTGTNVGTQTRTATLTVNGQVDSTTVVSAVLPSSRSAVINGPPATAFGTIINAGSAIGVNCGLSLGTGIPGTFSYQTTDPATNAATGLANTPINIAPGAPQSYVFAVTPTSAFPATDVAITAKCTNSSAATTVVGLNTLLLSASATPVPDIVALAASVDPGYVDLPGNTGTGAFSVATVNVGAAAAITVTADTGLISLPVAISLCQTNAQAACINPTTPASSVNLTIAANATPTFSIFVTGSGAVANDPAKNRVFVRFNDSGGATRGSTSVAVRTQ